nr:acetylxylan esterase 2 [Quercus suber]
MLRQSRVTEIGSSLGYRAQNRDLCTVPRLRCAFACYNLHQCLSYMLLPSSFARDTFSRLIPSATCAMSRSLFAAVLALGALASAQTTISNVTSSACPSQGGAHIIVARASLEAPGYGIIGAVKDAVLARVPGSTAESVGYPATLANYTDSETAGVLAMRSLINAFIANCAGSPLVVMGYSQGAQVSADSLVGQEDKNFPDGSPASDPLSESTLARTAAVIMMGDPSLVVNETFHVGNSTKNSIFPREDVSNFNIAGLASRTQSYCDDGDPYCAAGGDLIVHLSYVQEYGSQAADFVVNNIKSWYGDKTSNGTSVPTPTGYLPSGSIVPATAYSSGVAATGASSAGWGPSQTISPTPTATHYNGAAFNVANMGMIGVLGGTVALLLRSLSSQCAKCLQLEQQGVVIAITQSSVVLGLTYQNPSGTITFDLVPVANRNRLDAVMFSVLGDQVNRSPACWSCAVTHKTPALKFSQRTP